MVEARGAAAVSIFGDQVGSIMKKDSIPPGLEPAGNSLEFTESTIPDALLYEHSLAAGRWGVLNVIEGSLRFVDLEKGEEHTVSAPGQIAIRPEAPHHVALDGEVRCRIDFFRELGSK